MHNKVTGKVAGYFHVRNITESDISAQSMNQLKIDSQQGVVGVYSNEEAALKYIEGQDTMVTTDLNVEDSYAGD